MFEQNMAKQKQSHGRMALTLTLEISSKGTYSSLVVIPMHFYVGGYNHRENEHSMRDLKEHGVPVQLLQKKKWRPREGTCFS